MTIVIGLILLFIISILLIQNNKKDMIVMCLLTIIVVPNLNVGNIYIPIIYILIPIIAFLMIFLRSCDRNQKLCISKSMVIYTFMIGILLIVGTISWLNSGNMSFKGVINLVGRIKVIIFLWLTSIIVNSYEDKDVYIIMDKFILFIIIINVICVLFQIFIPGVSIEFFRSIYWSPSNQVLDIIINSNKYTRIPGTFQSPLDLGGFMLLVSTYLIIRSLQIKNKKYIVLLILSIFLGLSSLSKMYIIGLPIISILIALINNKNIDIKKIIKVALLIFFIAIISYNILEKSGTYAQYYFDYIMHPIEALKTRYSNNDDLLLSKTYEVIKENLLIGVGFESIEGEFLGDSLYVGMLHEGGIIQLSIFATLAIVSLLYTKKVKDIYSTLLIISILIINLGLPILYENLIIPFLFFILEINNNRKIWR